MKIFLSSFALALFLAACFITGFGQTAASKAEKGSNTAKAGFKNETEIAAKFNNWKTDADAERWLASMGYAAAQIVSVAASKPHGEKTDVQVVVTTSKDTFKEGISIKLVSNPNGFNQIDKRWLANYAKLWKMPADVTAGLKFFLGEKKPDRRSRNAERMFLNELDAGIRDKIVNFFSENREAIVSDIFEGDGEFAAKWFMVAYKASETPRWILRPASDAVKFFSEGPVTVTRAGNLKIGRITMQRKGGDGGRETAKMLQFKINPALLLDAK
jgi:hypothetical protein